MPGPYCAYVSLLAPGKTDYYTACHPRKTTTCILHVVPITAHTHDRPKSIGKKKPIQEKKVRERKENTRNRKKRKRKGKERKDKESNKILRSIRQEEEARKGKEKKMLY